MAENGGLHTSKHTVNGKGTLYNFIIKNMILHNQRVYINRKDKFTIKNFENLEVGDCLNLQEDIFSPKAKNHIFVTINDCKMLQYK